MKTQSVPTKTELYTSKKKDKRVDQAVTRRAKGPRGSTVRPPFDVERAVASLVRVVDEKGDVAMGVLVDDFILTACHCLPREGGRVLLPNPDLQGSEAFPVRVTDYAREKVAFALIASADPCSDIVVLHHTTYSGTDLPMKEWNALDGLREALKPAKVNIEMPTTGDEPQPPVPVWLITHDGKWISGTLGEIGFTAADRHNQFRGGTSGAPVFDQHGRVLGLVSSSSTGTLRGIVTRLWSNLPGRVLERLRAAGSAT